MEPFVKITSDDLKEEKFTFLLRRLRDNAFVVMLEIDVGFLSDQELHEILQCCPNLRRLFIKTMYNPGLSFASLLVNW